MLFVKKKKSIFKLTRKILGKKQNSMDCLEIRQGEKHSNKKIVKY